MNVQHDPNCTNDPYCSKGVSWRAVLAGSMVAFGLIFLFNLLTIGGGLAAYTRTEKGLEALIFIAYLWTVAGSFLMLFLAGLVTSMVLHHGKIGGHCHGVLHGFITWVVYILISLAFLSHVTDNTIVVFPQNFMSISNVSSSAASTVPKLNVRHSSRISSEEPASPSETTSEAVATQKQAHKIGVATLASFFIFLVEAIACCFGASCGLDLCRRKW